jgi:hypothetical protein
MNNKENTTIASGAWTGFYSLLTVAFIVLKLTGVINWSWLWVLSPLWISAILTIIILLILLIIFIILKKKGF